MKKTFFITVLVSFASLCHASLPPEVAHVRDLVSQLELQIGIKDWSSFRKVERRNAPGSTLYSFEVENWSFTTTSRLGFISGSERSLGGAKPGRPTRTRPDGISRQDAERKIKQIVSRLNWVEDRDYVISNSVDAEHPEFGSMAEAQGGLHVIELGSPAKHGFEDVRPRGNFTINISTGAVVQLSIIPDLPVEKFESLASLVPVREAAEIARAAVLQQMGKGAAGAPDELPGVEILSEQVKRIWGFPRQTTSDQGIRVDGLPESLIAAKIRPAIYSFHIKDWNVHVHATTGRVVTMARTAGQAAAPARNPNPAPTSVPPAPSSLVQAPSTSRPEPPTAPPIPLLVGGGVAILGVGAVFLLARKRTP